MPLVSLFKRILNYIKLIFLDGLLIILPIALTIGIFAFFFRILKGWLAPIYRLEPEYLKSIPQSEILLVIILILLVGIIFRTFFMKTFISTIESIFFRIPLMNPVYSGIKQLVQAFTVPEKLTFQKVVLVQFPSKEIYSIGFLTREIAPDMAPSKDQKYYGVFVPTTPNPTTGFFIMVPENSFQIMDLTRQEAMSMIISGGIIQPERSIFEN